MFHHKVQTGCKIVSQRIHSGHILLFVRGRLNRSFSQSWHENMANTAPTSSRHLSNPFMRYWLNLASGFFIGIKVKKIKFGEVLVVPVGHRT